MWPEPCSKSQFFRLGKISNSNLFWRFDFYLTIWLLFDNLTFIWQFDFHLTIWLLFDNLTFICQFDFYSRNAYKYYWFLSIVDFFGENLTFIWQFDFYLTIWLSFDNLTFIWQFDFHLTIWLSCDNLTFMWQFDIWTRQKFVGVTDPSKIVNQNGLIALLCFQSQLRDPISHYSIHSLSLPGSRERDVSYYHLVSCFLSFVRGFFVNIHDVSILLLSSILYLRTCMYGYSFFLLSEVLRETKKDTIFLWVPYYLCLYHAWCNLIKSGVTRKSIGPFAKNNCTK